MDHATEPIKVGVITDQTGPLSFMGIANANVARMVIDDINAQGGLLGRQLELYLEDSETTDSAAAAKAAKLVQEDHVDVILGGIYSSTRQAIKGPAVVDGRTLYIYPEQYEGQECDPLIFCTGPVPAQQVEPLIPWLMAETGAKTFYFPSADYIWPHVLNEKVREVVTANGGSIVGEEYFPLDHTDYRRDRRPDHRQRCRGRLQHDRPPGALTVPRAPPRLGLREARRITRLHVLRRELPEPRAGRARRGPVQLPRLLRERRRSVQQGAARSLQRALSGRRQVHGRQRMLGDVPRAEAVGGRRHRGRVTRPGRRRRGARSRGDRPRTGRPGRRWCPASTTFG